MFLIWIVGKFRDLDQENSLGGEKEGRVGE